MNNIHMISMQDLRTHRNKTDVGTNSVLYQKDTLGGGGALVLMQYLNAGGT